MSVEIVGLKDLMGKFAMLGENGIRISNAIVSGVADGIVNEAKQNAPADLGKIRQGINKEVTTGLIITAKIAANAPESPYQEFGTGGKVQVPEEMADIASSFQGVGGGSMADFILALIGWIKRKGLTNTYSVSSKRVSKRGSEADNEAMAWGIAKKILREGLRPQPFLYPAFVNGRNKLVPLLEKAYIEMLKSV